MNTNEKIIELKNNGKTYSEIAIFLGITKGSVSGRIARMRANGVTHDNARKPCEPSKYGKRSSSGVSKNITDQLIALKPNQCRYIIGDIGKESSHFCGKKTKDGKAYCDHHEKICHMKIDKEEN